MIASQTHTYSIFAVELKTGPIFAFYKSNIGPFSVVENLVLPAERRGCFKNKQNNQKTHFCQLNIGQIMLRNMLGLVLNLYLDQFLTFEVVLFFLLEPPILKCLQQEKQNLRKHKKENMRLCLNTLVLIVLVKMSGFFCISHFGGFRNFQILERCF